MKYVLHPAEPGSSIRLRCEVCRRLLAAALALALSLLSPLCAAVVGGAGVDPNTVDSPWAGVGAVETGNGHFSGALIGPRHVLTAAHVVAGRPLEQVAFRLNRGDAAPPIPARAIHIHPDYRGTVRGGIWHDDLAIIELRHPAPAGTPVYQPYSGLDLQNAQIVFVGYGGGGDGVQGPVIASSPSAKRIGYNRVKALTGKPGGMGRLDVFLFDFDVPADPKQRDGPQGAWGDGLEATFAGGDSGAPVFVYHAGGWRIMGVAAFVMAAPDRTGRYGSMAGGMLVPNYLAWLKKVQAQSQTAAANNLQ